ncbi:MAG TPA: glycosyl transferase family protein [Bryobacteraceae bacterium]|nr:glycosyl transferase family protein [Bryobacteraceae bacterium]
MWLDHWVLVCLIPLAMWILLSGLDDLFIDLVFFLTGKQQFPWPSEAELALAPRRRIAILVPLWREDRVIGKMLDHNLSVILYENYDVFVGVYPNDEPTIRAVWEASRRHARVHVAICPQPGPTSKGDCLNSLYERMREFERENDAHFDVILTHDAEDLVHPESLRLIDHYASDFQMVQIPVLPLPTGSLECTHSLYCDEFAEYQIKDIPVRQRLGGFLPSNGVGTGFSRAVLESLAAGEQGRVFDPDCLTEDYENGFRVHAHGYRQIFVPLRFVDSAPVATREFFPARLRQAVRQRSRWVAGIALQGWERHGWRVPRKQLYWFWRDRKGLIGNLFSPVANVLFVYWTVRFLWTGRSWEAGASLPVWLLSTFWATLVLSVFQMGVRAQCAARVYGWRFAAAVPVRVLWGNLINCSATVAALWQFASARLQRRAVTWRKTEHVYPRHGAVPQERPRLGEVLVRMRWLSMGELHEALPHVPKGVRIGEYLVQLEKLSEDHLYKALSSQNGIPFRGGVRQEISRQATRVLPAAVARRCRVLPYRVTAGQLHVATAEVPSEDMMRELTELSPLEIRLRLVRPREFEDLAHEYLPQS